MATDVTPPPAKPSPEPPSSTTTSTSDVPPSTPVAAAAAAPRPPESSADVINIPSYSRNAIIRRSRENPTRKITFTEVRKTVVGDVGSIRRVFDFLEAWGLINYSGGSNPKQPPQLKWEDKETKSTSDATAGCADVTVTKKRVCSGCKTPCTIACFASDKHDMTLCARCYVRGNYRVGLCSIDFKRVEIDEETKTEWSDKETLQLLEAIIHYGDDWRKVAEHVGGRSVKECVARFIKLPFGEQFDGPPESVDPETQLDVQSEPKLSKKMRLSPLADSSNPIMAQVAFLSTLVGVGVAEVAARAAIVALSDLGNRKHHESLKVPHNHEKQQDNSKGKMIGKGKVDSMEGALVEAKLQLEKEEQELEKAMEGALVEVKLQLEKEEQELEKAISGIAVETKEIEEKILHFEEVELQMEKKRQQFQQLQNLLFVDQLTLLFRKTDATKKAVDNIGDVVKID